MQQHHIGVIISPYGRRVIVSTDISLQNLLVGIL